MTLCACGHTPACAPFPSPQSFPATDQSIGKELTNKFRGSGSGVEWKRANVLKTANDKGPFHLFNRARMGPINRQGQGQGGGRAGGASWRCGKGQDTVFIYIQTYMYVLGEARRGLVPHAFVVRGMSRWCCLLGETSNFFSPSQALPFELF